MSETFDKVCVLVERGEVKISDHGYDEMSDENILAREVLAGVSEGIVVEDYPTYAKGPVCSCCKGIWISVRSMSFGEFRKACPRRRLLSQPTDLILICGPKILRGGKHEKEAAHKTCS
jgi:hypothetical protein